MKKTLIAAAVLVALTACNKSLIETPALESECGYINLGISADAEMVVTKVQTTVENPDSYNIKIYDSSSPSSYKFNGKHSSIGEKGVSVVTGNNYVVEAENITITEAESEYGALRLFGKTQDVTVEAGKTTSVTVACSPQNTQVTIAFESSFTSLFTNYSVKLTNDTTESHEISTAEGIRTLDMYVNSSCKSAYYNVTEDDNVSLKWVLTATNKDSVEKQYYKIFTSAKATKTTLSFAANGENGSIKVTITADESMTSKTTTYTIDPITDQITESSQN